MISGTVPSIAQKFYVTRKVTAYLTGTSSVQVSPSSLGVVDGAKILSFKVSSITGRTLSINVPNGTSLAVNDGSSIAPYAGQRKTVFAPYSRLPTIKVNIPDLLAAPLNSDSTEQLFSISSEGSGEHTFRVTYTAKYLA